MFPTLSSFLGRNCTTTPGLAEKASSQVDPIIIVRKDLVAEQFNEQFKKEHQFEGQRLGFGT
jgi:hypothetical protein